MQSRFNHLCYWMSLYLIPGLGNVTAKNLLQRFGNAENIFGASLGELTEVYGVQKKVAERIKNRQTAGDPAKILRNVEKYGARVVTYLDSEYPQALKQIHDPPMILHVKGKDIPHHLPLVAVVGSRNATHYGLKAAERIGQDLALQGLGVVSGMARGIDSAAHWGCLRGRGFTVAVLGTGIDTIYPKSNAKLFQKIIQQGTVISEFPLGASPEPRNFPARNRIISGLCRGVVVVEATMKSGSLITASFALEQGREVFAVPGSIFSFKSTGCHFLVKQGARLIENSDDILEELGLKDFSTRKPSPFEEAQPLTVADSEKKIYDQIGDYPIHIDQITKQSQLQPAQVSSALTKMELKGAIRQLAGKMFVR